MSHIAFYGLGQVYLQSGKEENTYEVDLSSMRHLERREGYDKLGANAIFDNDMKIMKIKTDKERTHVSHD